MCIRYAHKIVARFRNELDKTREAFRREMYIRYAHKIVARFRNELDKE